MYYVCESTSSLLIVPTEPSRAQALLNEAYHPTLVKVADQALAHSHDVFQGIQTQEIIAYRSSLRTTDSAMTPPALYTVDIIEENLAFLLFPLGESWCLYIVMLQDTITIET